MKKMPRRTSVQKPIVAEQGAVLTDFKPTPEQLVGARQWLVRMLARRAVELVREKEAATGSLNARGAERG